MRTCEVEGCEGKHLAKGMCSKHYRAALKKYRAENKPRTVKVCEVDGCERKHAAKGMCRKHYSTSRKKASREADPEYQAKVKERERIRESICSKEGCEESLKILGLCSKHYSAKWYAENKQRIKERRARYYADPKNKQRMKERAKEYRADPEVRQRTKEYNAAMYATPEYKQRMKEYDAARSQKKKVYLAKRRTDPEVKQRMKEWHAKWYAENKQRIRENYVRTGGAGLQPDAPNYVYIVANDELGAAKVGIGTRGRVANHTSKGWEIVYLSPLMTKQDALKLERAIIGYHGVGGVVPGRHLTKEEMPDGYTETFDLRELDAVLGIMPILCGESDRVDHKKEQSSV